MLDTKALAAATAAIVREHLASELAPLLTENKALRERVAALEARSVEAGPAGADGQDGRDGKDGQDGRDGKDVDPVTLRTTVSEMVQAEVSKQVPEAIAALPAPERGEKGEDGERGADGDAGADGQDGRDGADGKDGVDGQDGKDGRDGIDGKDGAGIADLVIDRDGNLIASFTDGRMKHLGQVVGKDGRDGDDGKDGIPFGVDDLDMTLMEDGRTLRMSFTKGDTEYAFQIPFPVVIDRGVFADGKSYEEGDGVTWGGSFWIAQRATGSKPDSDGSGWRLAVKRGRDGKDKT
ncbi:Collagen triple helix repeat (20 copies) [Sphingobium yanoikuyae]|uniref:Collagen triple helix repeat (20 copies) n=1 Tax=Sphingobium yanoikuyae TaxID=13690 RepID=A0A084E6F0_SPHYA|nr:hypothetical protein [Sphingobium yanoikuyae]KEZ13542.1 Collagen triple helix repeat (20 copies) [Sphingobium yanoikuyae]